MLIVEAPTPSGRQRLNWAPLGAPKSPGTHRRYAGQCPRPPPLRRDTKALCQPPPPPPCVRHYGCFLGGGQGRAGPGRGARHTLWTLGQYTLGPCTGNQTHQPQHTHQTERQVGTVLGSATAVEGDSPSPPWGVHRPARLGQGWQEVVGRGEGITCIGLANPRGPLCHPDVGLPIGLKFHFQLPPRAP